MTTHRRIAGLRLDALFEIALFFLIALGLTFFLDVSPRYIETWPHPFWIIVLTISVQYGSTEGLFAVLIATLALLLFNLPEQQINQDFYDWLFTVSIRPLMWLMAAVIIGELALRKIRRENELEKELRESRERETTFARHYEQAKTRKEKLELNIAGQLRSETASYRAAKAIEKLNPGDVVEGVSDLVQSALGPEKFSLYLLQGDVLERRMSYGWDKENEALLDDEYRSHTQLYQSIIGRKETLSVVNEDHEIILSGQGVLAGPLVDTENNTVLGMLKIEDLPFLEMNLNTVQTFQAICEWVALAIVNAQHYQTAVDDSTVNPEHNLMTRSFFNRYKDYITALAQRLKFNVYTLNVNVANADTLDADARINVARLLSQAVHKSLRTVDFAFDHQQTSGDFAIILPATDAKGAKIVRDKIEKELLSAASKRARGAQFAFSLSPLHEV